MDFTGLGFAIGSACCCISTFLVLVVALSFAFRPKKPKAADLEGVAPAPVRGVQTQASLTKLEAGLPDDIGATTVMAVEAKRPAAPAKPAGNVVPGPAKPPDPTATIPPPRSDGSNPRILRPNPTVTPGSGPPPNPPKKG